VSAGAGRYRAEPSAATCGSTLSPPKFADTRRKGNALAPDSPSRPMPPRPWGYCCSCSRPELALSWPDLPCALKAAILICKRTLGDPRQSGAPQAAVARPSGLLCGAPPSHGQNGGFADSLDAAKAACPGGGGASAIGRKRGRDMLDLSLSGPRLTLARPAVSQRTLGDWRGTRSRNSPRAYWTKRLSPHVVCTKIH
jgi:hypothetical protein